MLFYIDNLRDTRSFKSFKFLIIAIIPRSPILLLFLLNFSNHNKFITNLLPYLSNFPSKQNFEKNILLLCQKFSLLLYLNIFVFYKKITI